METFKEAAGQYYFRKHRYDTLPDEQREKLNMDAKQLKNYEPSLKIPEENQDDENVCAKDFMAVNLEAFKNIASNVSLAMKLWLNGVYDSREMLTILDKVVKDAKTGEECCEKGIVSFTKSSRNKNVEERVKVWRKNNPTGDQQACARDTGISKSSVYKYWGEDDRIQRRKRKKKETVENLHTNPPGENSDDLQEVAERKKYYEDGELITE